MKSPNQPLAPLVKITLCLAIYLNVLALQAQVSITSLTPYSQDFNGLTQNCPAGTSVVSVPWGNNSTLNGWYAASASNGAVSAIYASHGQFLTEGLVSNGNHKTQEVGDRSLGWVTSNSTGHGYSGIRLKNNTGDVIRHFTVAYTAEVWTIPPGNKSSSIQVDYQTGDVVTGLLSTGWTNVPTLAVTITKNGGGGGGYVDGNSSSNRLAKTVTISDIDVAPGQEIMFRFTYTNNNNYGFYMAIDDLTITPSGTSETYYAKSTGALNNLTTWGLNTDGTGANPPRFARSYQTFSVVNNIAPTLTASLTVSGTNSKVIVGNGITAVNCLIPAAYSFTGKIDVLDNATVTVSNAASPTFGALAGTSMVHYNGTSAQVLPLADFENLALTGGNKTLSANTLVKNNLNFSGAKLLLGNFNLTIEDDASITGADNASFIVTSGTGSLKRTVKNDDTEVLFPVGTANYFPVKIKQAVTGVSDIYSVRVIDGIFAQYTSNVPSTVPWYRYDKGIVDKTWIVDEAVIGGSNVTLTVEWDALSAKLEGFNLSQTRLNHYKDGVWDDFTPSEATQVSGRFSTSRSGIDSFSPYGVFFASPSTLPVELMNFEVTKTDGGVTCRWETATEKDNSHFTVERSQEGKEFLAIGSVKGAGTTTQQTSYSFLDPKPLAGTAYYRLRQTDLDGKFSFSQLVRVSAGRQVAAIKLYPNPGNGMRILHCNQVLAGKATILIRNSRGQIIKKFETEACNLQQGLKVDLKDVAPGLYSVEVLSENETAVMRAVQQ